jgi:cyclopropane fatty-acyl-phospholipid synthase-like methyltransferase
MSKSSTTTGEEFNKVYRSIGHWIWTDKRIPTELKEIVVVHKPKTSLELGCGLGIFSGFMASQGIKATGVDFSSVAIEKANKRVANYSDKPEYIVGDVTDLKEIDKQFDVSFDVGCFHCLDKEGQQKYISGIQRLLNPGATLLIWALDSSPSGIKLSPKYIEQIFGEHFNLDQSKFSRRRIASSHWYWLIRKT